MYISDTKTGDVQLSVQNEDGPEPQSLSRPIPAPELVISGEYFVLILVIDIHL